MSHKLYYVNLLEVLVFINDLGLGVGLGVRGWAALPRRPRGYSNVINGPSCVRLQDDWFPPLSVMFHVKQLDFKEAPNFFLDKVL